MERFVDDPTSLRAVEYSHVGGEGRAVHTGGFLPADLVTLQALMSSLEPQQRLPVQKGWTRFLWGSPAPVGPDRVQGIA